MLKWLESESNIVKLTNQFATILEDNKSAKDLSENPTYHKRTKHINISYYFIRDIVEQGYIKVVYVNTKQQLANTLTKGTTKPLLD
jgi:hypothetical protein